MPFGYVAGAISLGETVNGLVSGGGGSTGGFSGGSTPPQAFIPTGQPGADQQYQALAGNMFTGANALPGQITPGLQKATTNLVNNPYAGMAQGGANTAGMYGTQTLAPSMATGANQLFGLGNSGAPYGSQILQTGFDPQQALYNRTLGQVTDQSNAINAMYGLGSSPAGAGLTQQNTTNFNIDWQNAQLQRQTEAAAGYGNIVQGVGKAYSGGADLGTAANSMYANAAAQPYGAYQTIQGNNVAALNNLGSGVTNAYGLDANTLNALAAYLKLGQSATTVGQAGAKQNAANMAALGPGLSSGLNSLSNLFGNSGNPNSGSNVTTSTQPYNSYGYGGVGPSSPNPYGAGSYTAY